MLAWLEALIAAVSAATLILTILCILIRRRFSSSQQVVDTPPAPPTSLAKTAPFHSASKRPISYPLFRRGSSAKPLFNWSDHPSLIVDAVENGWSRFAFTNYSSPSVKSSLLRVTGDHHNHNQVELTWEVSQESSDFIQKIRCFHKSSNSSTARMALPLPGPPPSFPQEAYFEIRVIRSGDDENDEESRKSRESENVNSKLIEKNNSCILTDKSGRRGTGVLEEVKVGGGRRGEGVKMSLGLTAAGGSLVGGRMPGSYPASVAFNSDGSVYLAGMKLSSESEKEDWAEVGKVIGCGFNPTQKKVFFTVDSEMIHVIHCKSEDFGMPLYPIITANTNLTLLVNLGQSSFTFTPANAQRTPNPCFIGHGHGSMVTSSPAALGYDDDSHELFSMGRIDSEWLTHNGTVRSTVSLDESEVEFFEIVLDSSRVTNPLGK